MSQIIPILNFEEGYIETPYLDTLGFPTVAGGIRIGPKGAPISSYIFRVPRKVGDVWKQVIVDEKVIDMNTRPAIYAALKQCNPARADVLYSMAYQMGVDGLAAFKNTLVMISNGNFTGAAEGMLNSLWAKQTPGRARRHAEVMRTGSYDIYKGKI
ncbi:glycoside hydrolase family protein [Pantoea agglomerans]|uniref:glycoside hydrolase family protein n=1 Tax=Enterobacter agglomerans TaxID=549 RepID=UPI0013B777EB|nr:glycoside hydrolase family protein [Pantoea agglomerans]NEG57981.1 glycoside hydrolase family protein [Pantoea agglomerans]NEG99695.1 glycoside hydrolase family protein [Pantoea agglomerans]NEH04343.1 glycoside hydrolase family protein [Pantoea agglomerans]NEH14254.1 glycoside hydrolase family protein [Pantoea agglomerans]